ncbi:COP9 signalosome complex subunit 5 [Gracilariopsis chorda]|uniref:COP9 signalosome complex subunit 5 n=1 Tax=Gracilariopsis chorda TaxID=448386 RepID=A0A2V3J6S3_9FLOR|nr:COP9 signalosome complex subunit 5 [Gracilariopsis chorda]|eukprot:PXF50121.1 COP9 signalosome complex subunit 5 [Gracilariopsis chorda]
MNSVDARRAFEIENDITQTTAQDDIRYFYDDQEQARLRERKPWSQDPNWFKDVHISAVALIKMAMHARSGGSIEIMGSMQGKVADRAFIVMDVFPLPVEGTETRVSAGQAASEFLVTYSTECNQVARRENIIGWYHSHPGYGCWLSGIDVQTQSSHQQYEDPFLAIVIDPVRTISAGKVDLGAFRTYPLQYKPPAEGMNEYQTIPLNKIEDFGVHCNSYYPLEVSYFKSTLDATLLDLLWNKYWARALSTSPLVQSKDYVVQQLTDISNKLKETEKQMEKGNPHGRGGYYLSDKKTLAGKGGGHLDQISKDAQKCCSEHVQSIMSMYIKNAMFSPSHMQN